MHTEREIISFLEEQISELLGKSVDWRFSKWLEYHLKIRLLEFFDEDDIGSIEIERTDLDRYSCHLFNQNNRYSLFVIVVENTDSGRFVKRFY